jgi:hypothetical protein
LHHRWEKEAPRVLPPSKEEAEQQQQQKKKKTKKKKQKKKKKKKTKHSVNRYNLWVLMGPRTLVEPPKGTASELFNASLRFATVSVAPIQCNTDCSGRY